MTQKKFENFEKSWSLEFFCDFFGQTLIFLFSVLPWSDFFQTLLTYYEKYLLSDEQRKKLPFFP